MDLSLIPFCYHLLWRVLFLAPWLLSPCSYCLEQQPNSKHINCLGRTLQLYSIPFFFSFICPFYFKFIHAKIEGQHYLCLQVDFWLPEFIKHTHNNHHTEHNAYLFSTKYAKCSYQFFIVNLLMTLCINVYVFLNFVV